MSNTDATKKFRYYEGLCSADNFPKELAKVLATGVVEQIDQGDGTTFDQTLKEKNWNIVYPVPDSNYDDDNLNLRQYLDKIKNQVDKIDNHVILETTTTTKQEGEGKADAQFEFSVDEDTLDMEKHMYLEIFKPKYIADPEQYPLDCELRGITEPKVITKELYEKKYLDHLGYEEELSDQFDATRISGGPAVTKEEIEQDIDGTPINDLSYDDLNNYIDRINIIRRDESFERPRYNEIASTSVTLEKPHLTQIMQDDPTLYAFIKKRFTGLAEYGTFETLQIIASTTEPSDDYNKAKFQVTMLASVVKTFYSIKKDTVFVLEHKPIDLAVPELYKEGIYIPIQQKYYQVNRTSANVSIKFLNNFEYESTKDGMLVVRYEYSVDASGNLITERESLPNNHYILMRLFDNIDTTRKDRPAENVYDNDGNVVVVNSRPSPWVKLSWYQDFEEVMIDTIDADAPINTIADGSVFVPLVTPGLNGDTKLQYWINTNNDRFSLIVMGNASLDYSRDRHLISSCYCGAIDSFENSVTDISGNFALYASSSTEPCKTVLDSEKTHVEPAEFMLSESEVQSINTTISNILSLTVAGTTIINVLDSVDISSLVRNDWSITPSKSLEEMTTTERNEYNAQVREAETHFAERVNQVEGYITQLKSYTSQVSDFVANAPYVKPATKTNEYTIGIHSKDCYFDNNAIKYMFVTTGTNIPLTGLKNAVIKERQDSTNDGKIDMVKIQLDSSVAEYGDEARLIVNYGYYKEKLILKSGVSRDMFGNVMSVAKEDMYGIETSDGITSIMMFHSRSKNYYQKHRLLFATTEEYMSKKMYGKSRYTGEYYADRIKVTHSNDGPRGILSDVLVIDNSGLFPLDELVINKDFEKSKDEPEETFIYFPVTAPYSPLSDGPNARYGIAIKKSEKAPRYDDEKALVDAVIKYIDMLHKSLWDPTESDIYPPQVIESIVDEEGGHAGIYWKVINKTREDQQDLEFDDTKGNPDRPYELDDSGDRVTLDYEPLKIVVTNTKELRGIVESDNALRPVPIVQIDPSDSAPEGKFAIAPDSYDMENNNAIIILKGLDEIPPADPGEPQQIAYGYGIASSKDEVITASKLGEAAQLKFIEWDGGRTDPERFEYGIEGMPFTTDVGELIDNKLALIDAIPDSYLVIYKYKHITSEEEEKYTVLQYSKFKLTRALLNYPCTVLGLVNNGKGKIAIKPASGAPDYKENFSSVCPYNEPIHLMVQAAEYWRLKKITISSNNQDIDVPIAGYSNENGIEITPTDNMTINVEFTQDN